MDLGLRDKRVLVTGSSRGIGLGIAREFLAEGARVMLTGRDSATLTNAALQLESPNRVLSFVGDLTQPGTMAGLLAEIEARWEGLDVLVLNLGSGRSRPALEADSPEWIRVFQINLFSAMETLRLAEPLLKRGNQPAVVFIGSIAGIEALGAPIAYGAAKAALEHAMRSAARLLAPAGIRVNLAAPGNIFFEGGTWDSKLREDKSAVDDMLESQVPLRRLGSVGEVAAAVVFLASNRASFITGTCLVVDGGQTRS